MPQTKRAESQFRLLPSERVLWLGGPVKGAPRDWFWVIAPGLVGTTGLVAALSAALLGVLELSGTAQLWWMATYFAAFSVALWIAPGILQDQAQYAVTDRRVLWRRGQLHRWIDRQAISYARIHWNRTRSDVGHLELVRATPFGPLLRKQRVWLHNVHMPDRLLALINDVEPGTFCGDAELPIIDRLPTSECIVWGDHPHGSLLGIRNLATGALGLGVLAAALRYGGRAWSVLLQLEGLGLQVRSWTWLLLFSAISLSCLLMLSIGAGLLWHGLWRARSLGQQTEYVITDKRVVIRRGRTELYLERRHIVDVAIVPASGGMRHLFLILDDPDGRALSDSGALTPLPPARDLVAPVMYELIDPDAVRHLLLDAPGGDAPLEDAA